MGQVLQTEQIQLKIKLGAALNNFDNKYQFKQRQRWYNMNYQSNKERNVCKIRSKLTDEKAIADKDQETKQ